MAKLIHGAQLAHIKNNSTLWSNSAYTDLAKLALIFTDDGHIVVKGTDYKVALASNSEGTATGNRRLWSDSGVLKLTDSALFSYTGPHIDYVITSALGNSSKVYLLGGASTAATQAVSAKDTVWLETDASGNAKLVTPAINVSSGASGLTLNGTTITNYITQQIKDGLATNDAMVFAGTVKVAGNDFVITSHNSTLDYGKNGDTAVSITNNTTKLSDLKKYSAGWTWKVVDTGGTVTNIGTVEIGDMVMAVSNYGSTYSASDFTVVQANIDGAVTTATTLTANGLILGNGSKAVTVLTTSNTTGYLKPNGSSTPVWASFGQLTLDGTTTDFVFSPDASKSITIGLGLDITSTGSGSSTVYTLGHSNSITAVTTEALKKFKFDAQGHITGTADVDKLKFSAVNSSGTSVNSSGITDLEYDGNAAKTLTLKAGSNITLSQAVSGTIQITSTNTWRPVDAYRIFTTGDNKGKPYNIVGGTNTVVTETDVLDSWLASGTGTANLKFSKSFSVNSDGEIDIIWADVDSSGNITYSM